MDRILLDPHRWDILRFRWASLRAAWRPPSEGDAPAQKWMDEMFSLLLNEGKVDKAEKPGPAKWQKWAANFHKLAQNTPAFHQLYKQCADSVVRSAIATDAIYEAIEDIMGDPPPDGEGDGEGDGSGDHQKSQIERAIGKAAQQVSDFQDMTEAFGMKAGQGTQEMTAEMRADLHKAVKLMRNKPELKMLSLMAGRFRRVARAMREERVKHGADDVTDLERGSDLMDMVEEELARLFSPAQRALFLAELAAESAIQYRVEGVDRKGAGPVIVLLDKSGSMAGGANTWATAIALALMQEAHAEKRPFVFAPFQESVYKNRTVMPGEEIPLDVILTEPGGGTSISNALDFARNTIIKAAEKHGTPFSKADIICLTDDECDMYEDWVRQFHKDLEPHKTRVVGIGVGQYATGEGRMAWAHEKFNVPDVEAPLDSSLATALFSPRST